MNPRKIVCGLAAAGLLAAGASAAPATKPLLNGLDGSHYLPYKASLVRETQKKLEQKGLYKGEANGVLDRETMQATAEFQKQNGLDASGLPTPKTREKLGIE